MLMPQGDNSICRWATAAWRVGTCLHSGQSGLVTGFELFSKCWRRDLLLSSTKSIAKFLCASLKFGTNRCCWLWLMLRVALTPASDRKSGHFRMWFYPAIRNSDAAAAAAP